MSSSTANAAERMKIAIVGGGVAAMSCALHLAPLAECGLIASPIDVYEGPGSENCDIGVGVWSTALKPFADSTLWNDLMHHGRWLGEVGYRTPQGAWLARSELGDNNNNNNNDNDMPGLLFLQEMNLLESFRRAIRAQDTTIRLHPGAVVEGLVSGKTWSSGLRFSQEPTTTTHEYHLVVAANGMRSNLRNGADMEDRGYRVLRGNAVGIHATAFQTWGEGQSMRFATVPMLEHQAWFATTSDPTIKRKEELIEAFSSWHAPVTSIMEATDDISITRALAHTHPAIVRNDTGAAALVFVGDAFMTVDPVLAQGFTIAMEGAYALSQTVASSCQPRPDLMLSFDPHLLREQLRKLDQERLKRLTCLLRATQIVQVLGQPSGGVAGFVSKRIVRPMMRITPDLIRRPVFDAMLKYSLGL